MTDRPATCTPRSPHRDVAMSALSSASDFLGAAERLTPALCRQLRSGEVRDALADLTQLLTGIGCLARLAVDIEHVAPLDGAATTAIDLAEMAAMLRDFVASEERGDWAELAGRIETSLQPRFAAWREALRERTTRFGE